MRPGSKGLPDGNADSKERSGSTHATPRAARSGAVGILAEAACGARRTRNTWRRRHRWIRVRPRRRPGKRTADRGSPCCRLREGASPRRGGARERANSAVACTLIAALQASLLAGAISPRRAPAPGSRLARAKHLVRCGSPLAHPSSTCSAHLHGPTEKPRRRAPCSSKRCHRYAPCDSGAASMMRILSGWLAARASMPSRLPA